MDLLLGRRGPSRKTGLARELVRGAPRPNQLGGEHFWCRPFQLAESLRFRIGRKWSSISDSSEQDYPRHLCVVPTS